MCIHICILESSRALRARLILHVTWHWAQPCRYPMSTPIKRSSVRLSERSWWNDRPIGTQAMNRLWKKNRMDRVHSANCRPKCPRKEGGGCRSKEENTKWKSWSTERTRRIKKSLKIRPKISSDNHPRPQRGWDTDQTSKKSILVNRVHHHARQKRLKMDPKPRHHKPKMKTPYGVPNNNAFEYSLKPPKQAFEGQNNVSWDTWRRP